MSLLRTEPRPGLLDPETWEVPFQLTVDELYLQAGADRRAGPDRTDDGEDDR